MDPSTEGNQTSPPSFSRLQAVLYLFLLFVACGIVFGLGGFFVSTLFRPDTKVTHELSEIKTTGSLGPRSTEKVIVETSSPTTTTQTVVSSPSTKIVPKKNSSYEAVPPVSGKASVTVSSPLGNSKHYVNGELHIAWKSAHVPTGARVQLFFVSRANNPEEDLIIEKPIHTGGANGETRWTIPPTLCLYNKCDVILHSGVFKIVARVVPSNFCETSPFMQGGEYCRADTSDEVLAVGVSALFNVENIGFVKLTGGFGNTTSANGVITVPQGTELSMWWDSQGVSNCTMTPQLEGYGNGPVGARSNAKTHPIDVTTTYTIWCPLSDGTGTIKDSLEIRVQ